MWLSSPMWKKMGREKVAYIDLLHGSLQKYKQGRTQKLFRIRVHIPRIWGKWSARQFLQIIFAHEIVLKLFIDFFILLFCAADVCPQVRCSCNCGRSGFRRDERGCQTCECNYPCEVNQHHFLHKISLVEVLGDTTRSPFQCWCNRTISFRPLLCQ